VGQILTGLNLFLEMSARLPADELGPKLLQARTMVEDLIDKVDDLSFNLRPAILDDLGLLPAALWLTEQYTAQTGIDVHLEHSSLEQRFTPDIETAAYRIIQEALTNVARYANVNDVAVRLWVDQNILYTKIEDQGVGFDVQTKMVSAKTNGLSGMHERVVLSGGNLAVESTPGAGTRLLAEWPLP